MFTGVFVRQAHPRVDFARLVTRASENVHRPQNKESLGMNTLLSLHELGHLLQLHPMIAKRLADRGVLAPDFVTPGNGRLYKPERFGELRQAVNHLQRKRTNNEIL